MNQELSALQAELEAVRATPLEYLPQYGYSPKDEVIQLIQEDIDDLQQRIYEAEDLITQAQQEDERTSLCLSQGLPRFC